MESLTSEFGMGSGVPSPLWLPKKFGKFIETGMEGFFEKQDARAISTGQLHPSQGFHLQPINEVVYLGPSGLASGRTYLKAGFPLRCFQRLSLPAVPLARQQVHQWCVHPGPLVLGTGPFNSPTPTEDRDQTVSRRFKPSSRTTLNGEQPYPWDLLQPQDVMSRHRGAKPHRRCELLDAISLLSPAYLLSNER